MKKRSCAIMLIILFFLLLSSLLIAGTSKEQEEDWLFENFDEIEEAARSTRVVFAMWGGSASINKWIDAYVAEELKKRYDIELERIPMDASIFVNKLLTERQAGKKIGTMDLLWINGENFKNAMEASLLYGPFADKLVNFNRYVDKTTVEYDFGYPVNGYEVPYGRAQFVFEYDSAKIKEVPDNFQKLLEWVKKNPSRFTYPQPPDFTGSAFIRQAFYEVSGGYEQYLGEYDEQLFKKNSQRLWDYLNEMKPYLWQEGRSYPKDVATLETLFVRGEIDFSMSYNQSHAQSKIIEGVFPDTVRTFIMEGNSLSNTHFVAIPFNAPNKPGAMVTANFLLSVEAQHSKNRPENWGDSTILDLDRMTEEERALFIRLDLGEATLPLDLLSQSAVPEIGSEYLEVLETGWEEFVLRK